MEPRKTKQRTKILEILQETTSHPTANWIYDRVKDEFPNISMGTVYRNLGVLEEMGMIQKLSCGSTFDRYDANVEPHIHFVCTKCSGVLDVHAEIPAMKLKQAIDGINMQVDRYNLTCYGICDECQNSH